MLQFCLRYCRLLR